MALTELIFPEWRADSEFTTDDLERTLKLDAKCSSHPVDVDCPDANQINQIFDSLSYSKAASVLRMLSEYVGQETFLKGMSIYLKNHLYGNSDPQDLWNGISQAAGVDVGKLINDWLVKIGFPVLTVTETPDGIHIRQDHFLSTGDVTDEENQTIWQVPLALLSTNPDGKTSRDRTAVLSEREGDFKLDTSKPWRINAGRVSVFQTAYTPERLSKLGEEAARPRSVLGLEDRVELISDAMILARVGYGNTSGGLDLISHLHDEAECHVGIGLMRVYTLELVWKTISLELGAISSVWWEQPQEVIDALRGLRCMSEYLFVPLVRKLGYEYKDSESPDVHELRTIAITQSTICRDESVVHELRARFDHFCTTGDDSRIPVNLRRIVYRIVVQYGGEEEYEAVQKMVENPNSPTSKIATMLAMTHTQDKGLIEKTLAYIEMGVKDQDVMYYFNGFAVNYAAHRCAAEFFKQNYDKLVKHFEGNFSFHYLVQHALNSFSTDKDAQEIEEFFKDKDISKFNMAYAQMLETIHANAKWLDHSHSDIADWLSAWQKQMNA